MYEGSAARRMDAYEGAYAQPQMQPSFGIVEGAGLDARARAGVSAQFITVFKLAGMLAVVLTLLSFVRVGIYSATNSILINNSSMRTELKDARATRDELRIERSVLSSKQRISRIATQSYGMVLAEGSETMTIGAAAAAAEAAAAEAATAEAQAAAEAQAEAPVENTEEQVTEAEQSPEASVDASAAEALDQAEMTQGDGSTAGSNAVDVDSL